MTNIKIITIKDLWAEVLSQFEEAGADPSDNTVFTLRPADADLGLQRHFGEAESADNPALAKSVGPGAGAP